MRYLAYHFWNRAYKNWVERKRWLAHHIFTPENLYAILIGPHLSAISAMKYIWSDTFSGSLTPKNSIIEKHIEIITHQDGPIQFELFSLSSSIPAKRVKYSL